jgi:hypothetical protein
VDRRLLSYMAEDQDMHLRQLTELPHVWIIRLIAAASREDERCKVCAIVNEL